MSLAAGVGRQVAEAIAGRERAENAARARQAALGPASIAGLERAEWRRAEEAVRLLRSALTVAGLARVAAGVGVGRAAATVWVMPLEPADAHALAALVEHSERRSTPRPSSNGRRDSRAARRARVVAAARRRGVPGSRSRGGPGQADGRPAVLSGALPVRVPGTASLPPTRLKAPRHPTGDGLGGPRADTAAPTAVDEGAAT